MVPGAWILEKGWQVIKKAAIPFMLVSAIAGVVNHSYMGLTTWKPWASGALDVIRGTNKLASAAWNTAWNIYQGTKPSSGVSSTQKTPAPAENPNGHWRLPREGDQEWLDTLATEKFLEGQLPSDGKLRGIDHPPSNGNRVFETKDGTVVSEFTLYRDGGNTTLCVNSLHRKGIGSFEKFKGVLTQAFQDIDKTLEKTGPEGYAVHMKIDQKGKALTSEIVETAASVACDGWNPKR